MVLSLFLLIVLVDVATNSLMAMFYEQKVTESCNSSLPLHVLVVQGLRGLLYSFSWSSFAYTQVATLA